MGTNCLMILAHNSISVGCLNLQPEQSMFSVFMFDAEKTCKLLKDVGYSFEVHLECSKVSVVGSGMRGVPGIMATLLLRWLKKVLRFYKLWILILQFQQ